ncbi:DUF58 domain-containing protein [Amycolatopsis sp. 195334CR]|uniref:DUF58 domain-containing protein n=1 Tax=Amycolatopsis sp. 195334CR TaxID=2814588 RepID=UPI001A8DF950|nr:DUF58 domain-containing protein [Amycolatopsis sp. 195334CR]MBN6036772.1 DUF58 domain-containing protein [Amycolatopsis sp. 195334CR]
MAITGRAGLLALAGVVVAAVWPSGLTLLVLASVLLLAIGVDLVLAASVRALTFSRSGADSVRLGESAEVTLTVENPGTRTLRGRLRDAWQPSAGIAEDRHDVVIPGGEGRRVVARLTPTRRGDRLAVSVTVRSFGPLGLAARQGSHAVPWTLRALPPFHSRRHLASRLSRLRQLDGRQAVLIRGQGTEFDSLREYVIGDDVRSIDWRASARAADVMVRTWRPERDRHVVLVLDTGRVAAGRVGDVPRLDASMDAALLLAALAARAGDRVQLIAYDRVLRAAAQGAGPSLVNAMAPLEAELVEPDVRGMVTEVLRRAGQRSLVVLFTGLESVEDGLLPVLTSLTARHQVVVAAVADPRVSEMARARGDAEAVYDAAAAERTLAERRQVTGLLSRHGVDVVDAVPEELPPALADRYLALKAAGRL